MKYNCTLPESNGTPFQYSWLENPMDRGTWWAAVPRVTKSLTWLSDFTFTFHFHALEKEMTTHSSVLALRIPGTGSLVGCRLWRHIESDTTEARAAAAAAVEKYIKMSDKSIVLQGICSYSLKKTCIYVFIETFFNSKQGKF